MSGDDFDALVERALAEMPEELMAQLSNVAIFVEDEPGPENAGLLGVYDGVPLTERGDFYGAVLPDRITVFKNPILRICADHQEVVEEVHITVVHEIAHHFGIDDERLHALGYG